MFISCEDLNTEICNRLFKFSPGTWSEQFRQYFLGGGAQLKTPDLVHNSIDRYRLQTETMGTIHLELSVILRNFTKFGVET